MKSLHELIVAVPSASSKVAATLRVPSACYFRRAGRRQPPDDRHSATVRHEHSQKTVRGLTPNAAYFVATQMSGTALAAGFSHENRCEEPVASAIPLKVSGIGLTPTGSPVHCLSPRLAIVCCLLSLASAWLSAQTPKPDAAVETGRKALSDAASFPWYDQEKDAIRRVDVYPPKDLEARKSQWEVQPSNWTWPDWLTTVLEVLGWTILMIAIFVLIYLLAKAFMWGSWRSGTTSEAEESLHGDIDRIEALPFQLQRPKTDLLAEARRCYEAGQFSEAMVYLYSYQLVELDRHQLIRLTKGKTNRQYVRELRPRRPLADILFRSMIAFEDVFFGRHVLDRERFEACWRKLDEFHQFLAQGAA